jgi:hypothetical protein
MPLTCILLYIILKINYYFIIFKYKLLINKENSLLFNPHYQNSTSPLQKVL